MRGRIIIVVVKNKNILSKWSYLRANAAASLYRVPPSIEDDHSNRERSHRRRRKDNLEFGRKKKKEKKQKSQNWSCCNSFALLFHRQDNRDRAHYPAMASLYVVSADKKKKNICKETSQILVPGTTVSNVLEASPFCSESAGSAS